MTYWFLTYMCRYIFPLPGGGRKFNEWVLVEAVTDVHPLEWLLARKEEYHLAEGQHAAGSRRPVDGWYEYRLTFFHEIEKEQFDLLEDMLA